LERGSYSGSLFCHFDKTPLSRYQFNAVLKKALAYLNIPGLSKPFIPYWTNHTLRYSHVAFENPYYTYN
jgi:hypothetical protein